MGVYYTTRDDLKVVLIFVFYATDPRNRQGGNQNRCSYYDAEFSPTAEYYALICLGPGVPMVTLHKTVVVPQEEDKKPDEDDQKKKDSVSEPRAPQSSRRHPKISSKFVGTLENNTYLFVRLHILYRVYQKE